MVAVAEPEIVGVVSVPGSGEIAVNETATPVVSIVNVSVEALTSLVVLPLESVARTYIVCDPSDKAGDTLQVMDSVAELKLPSSAVQAVQVPEVASIWYWTLLTVPPVSVAEPVSAGVLSLFGSGDKADKVIAGGVTSLGVKTMETS